MHRSVAEFAESLRGKSILLWEDNQAVQHILTNRTTRSPEMMRLLRRLWLLIDSVGLTLTVRYIQSEENSLADALSRGSPYDELEVLPRVWRGLERRFGPHTIDRCARSGNAVLTRWNGAAPDSRSCGAGALAQDWRRENNYAFPPPTLLPQIAQLLFERPGVAATVVAPYWPAQPWFQQLGELATHVELRRLHDVARCPPQLHGSARHALTGAMLVFFRVEGRPATYTRYRAAQ